MTYPLAPHLPALHRTFLEQALPCLHADDRLVGVQAGGSYLVGAMDAYSDLDLVLAVEPVHVEAVMAERKEIANGLGDLLAAFTGEHVNEPRLLVCLYGPPALHVDLKFVSLPDAADRVEDPAILWERDGRLSAVLDRSEAAFPYRDVQWFEDRFWVWVQYLAAKIGRGELFEAHDGLAWLRLTVLGPLALRERDARPMGLRRIEQYAPEHARALQRTLAPYEPAALADALAAAAGLYRTLRDRMPEAFQPRTAAEDLALAYLDSVKAQL